MPFKKQTDWPLSDDPKNFHNPEWDWYWDHLIHCVIFDEAGTPHDLIDGKALIVRGAPTLTPKAVGVSRYFEGTVDAYEINPSHELTETSREFFLVPGSISAADQDLCTTSELFGDSTHDRDLYISQTTGLCNWYIFDGSTRILTSSTAAVDGDPIHLLGVVRSGEMRFYVNGVDEANSAAFGAPYTGFTSPIIEIGATNNAFGQFSGLIFRDYDTVLSAPQARQLADDPYGMFREPDNVIPFAPIAGATAALTGTAISGGVTEAEIAAGGETVIITLTGDTWAAAGTGPIGSTADTQALIDGFDAATSPTNGWNNEVRDKEPTTIVVRTSSTVATLTFTTAAAAYDITSDETITVTIPAATLVTSAIDVVADSTFVVTAAASGILPQMMMMGAGA